MKRIRQIVEKPINIDISSKKIHFETDIKGTKERFYRCTHLNCSYVACTPHNISLHIDRDHPKN
jgi:hypothetical protein